MNQHARTPVPPVTEADLRLLRIFRGVAEAGGLSAAEEKLGMERSTISRHLQALETRLGARLCFRGPAGFELTDFGERALRASIAACDALEAVRHELNLARDILTGELCIGIADNCLSNPQCRMAEALERFRRCAPDVTVNLSVGLPNDLVRDVVERRAHLAISGQPTGNTKLAYRPLFSEEFRLYAAAPGCDLAALREGRSVLVTRTNDRRTQTLAEQLEVGRRAVAFGLEAVATMIASGGFVGFLPTHYAGMLAPRYPLVEVGNAEALRYTTQFSLISLVERPLPPSGQLFVRLFTDIGRET
ncbi:MULTISPECIES: LysR family transcriptional regulator [Chelatococcus]|uniref:DNA-binding transcriptional LysR family regulator n=1 Tax=Chelatococcus caeni TaxID=1348468 RepID=A0A840C4B4_9HYPH|nr:MULTISPECIES: LysR family transcriptional regulator [Chelatococcus]ALA20415.1 transcriptional regulator [Chelatococcus sp. CO-6]MBB4018458.1 DNA-binding transcriptional LysR family regulator [Chelatococcus caeni]